MMVRKYPVFLYLCALLFVTFDRAAAEELDFRPLTFYLSDDPSILGAGGIDLEKTYSAPSIYHPAALPALPGALSCQYSMENVFHPKEGSWVGTKVGSESSEAAAVIPFDAPIVHKSAIAVLAKKFVFNADVPPDDRPTPFHASQKYEEGAVAFSAAPFSFLKAGIGREAYHDHAGLFSEIVLMPLDGVSLGYRTFKREMTLDASLMQSGHLAEMVLSPINESVRELSVGAAVPNMLDINLSIDTSRHGTGVLEGRVFLTESVDAELRMQKNKSDFIDGVTIDGAPGGHVSGGLKYTLNDLELHARSSETRYTAGIRWSSFELDGAGIASGGALLSFWQNLVAGDRYFNYDFSTRSTQYYIGMENKTTERLTLRGGLQYIEAAMDGNFDNWTPFPLLNIGKLDDQTTYLQYTRAVLGAVTLGLSYRYQDVELTYGFGQLVPLRTEKRPKEATATSGAEEGGAAGGKFHLGQIWDKIKENPGGNIQSVKVTWYF